MDTHIAHLRHRLGISQNKLAEITGISQARLSFVETGRKELTIIQQRFINALEHLRKLEREGKSSWYKDEYNVDVFRFG